MGPAACDVPLVLLLVAVLISFPASFVSAQDPFIPEAVRPVPKRATRYELLEDEKIANQYIIKLKDDRVVKEFVERNFINGESRMIDDYSAAFDGLFSAYMDSITLNQLMRNTDVEYIEDDGIVDTTQVTTLWGLDRIDERPLPLDGYNNYKGDGSCTHIYIIDTGTEITHPQFSGHYSTQGYDYRGPIGVDCHGHGTHCGGIAAGNTVGVAPGATIHSVKVLNCWGGGSYSSVIGGMVWVALNRIQPAVASMSLGGPKSFILNWVVAIMTNSYDVVAITAGATDITDTRASFSNRGTCLDIFAPGVSIYSSWKLGGYNTISGTSMACPHVTGAAAILRGLYPALSAEVIAAIVVDIAGPGSPNLLLFIGNECSGCSPNPCQNGGTCIYNGLETQYQANTCIIDCFTCKCPWPYGGPLCQCVVY